MITTLMNLDTIPEEHELLTLLGKNVFACYQSVCKAIVSLLLPDIELWDHAGRRGKYLHGYRVEKRAIIVDIYIFSVNDLWQCMCQFHLNGRSFEKIKKQMDTFCQKVQESFKETIEYKKKYRGTYLSLIVNDDTVQDVLKIVHYLS